VVPTDAGSPDAGPVDAGAPDIGPPDAGPADGGAADAGGPAKTSTVANLKIAFIGDQGLNLAAYAVLDLIVKEKAEAVLIQGDFDYEEKPELWESLLDSTLGPKFPVFASPGNHDMPKLSKYQKILTERLKKVPEAKCTGTVLHKQTCTFKGLQMVFTAPGLAGTGHAAYIDKQLKDSTHTWKVCSWHVNMKDMQTGAKGDEAGWPVYQTCQKHGAMIVTGHEHSYERTKTLTAVGDKSKGHGATGDPAKMILAKGKTFVSVTGTGGKEIRKYEKKLHAGDTWWATIYTSDYWMKNGVDQFFLPYSNTHGPLFVIFNVNGNPNKAKAYFKNTLGTMVDEFDITVQ